ncbi:hypothetical protein T439DRAFT_320899 [Meredithblackwellia eburnea MCA 4105]
MNSFRGPVRPSCFPTYPALNGPADMPTASTSSIGDVASRDSESERGKGEGPPKKRKRISYSCVACTQRKAKCDRGRPCGPCASRGASCRYLVDGYEDPVDFLKEVRDRLDRLETLFTRSIAAPPLSLSEPPPSSQPGLPDKTATGQSNSDPSTVDTFPGFVSRDGNNYFGPSASASVDDKGQLATLFQTYSAPHAEQRPKWGAQRRPPIDLFHDLPARGVCDNLVDYYFKYINYTRYPFDEDEFRTLYSEIWSIMLSGNMPPRILHLLPLFFIVLAISALTAPGKEVLDLPSEFSKVESDEGRRTLAHGLYTGACRAQASAATAFESKGDIKTVLSDLLAARYLILVRRASEGYEVLGTAIHRAYTLGLHRRQSGIPLADEENRKRTWSYLLHLDRYLALLLGLPLCIQSTFCDVGPPSNLSDDDGQVLPLGVLTQSTFLVLRNTLTEIAGRIALEAFNIAGGVSYSSVVLLEEALQKWENSLPHFFRLVPHGQPYDPPPPGKPELATLLEVQRYLLSTEVRFIRTTLHRPYLAHPGQKTALSRDACITSAKDDLWARLTAYPLKGLENLSSGSYRVSLSIVVLGVALLLTPSPEQAKEIRECLVNFVVARRGSSAHSSLDENTLRQIATRELMQLKVGIAQATAVSRSGGHSRSASPTVDPEAAAHPDIASAVWPDPPSGEADPVSYDIHASAQQVLNTLAFPGSFQTSTFDYLSLPQLSSSSVSVPDLSVLDAATLDYNSQPRAEPADEINWGLFNDVLADMGVNFDMFDT